MTRYLAYIAISLLSAIAAQATDISKMVLSGKRLTTTDGLSGNTVYDIQQDCDGFMWMGAASGLCRFDGYSFANHLDLGTKPGEHIEANVGNIFKDDANKLLWIRTSTYTLACYDLQAGRFIDYAKDRNRAFQRFIQTGNDVWMYDTRNGVRHIRIDGRTFRCTDYNEQNGLLPDNHVPRLVCMADGGAWVLTHKGLTRILPDGKVVPVVKNRKYIEAAATDGGIVCLSEKNRIEVFANSGRLLKTWFIPAALGNIKTIRSNFVWQGKWMLFSSKTIAINLKSGLAEANDEWQVPNGLLLDEADGFFFESNSSGALWIFPPAGEVKKMQLIPNMNFTAERRRKYSVKRGRDGLFYIATYGNGLFIYDHKADRLRHFSANDTQPVIDNNYLNAITIDRNGSLWIAQETMGVACVAVSNQSVADFILPVPERKGDWANYVRMVENIDGKVFISTRDNKLYTLNSTDNSVTLVSELAKSPYAMQRDRKGRTWIATRGDGLYIDNEKYDKYDKTLQSNILHDLIEDHTGRMWISTYEDGLLMQLPPDGKKERFRQLLNRNVNEGRLHKMAIDKKGMLWITTNNGLYVVDTKKTDITNKDFRYLNTYNNMFPFNEVRCVLAATDGSVWAGGKGSGLVRMTSDGLLRNIKLRTLTEKEGIANNTVNSIIEDRFGNVWVGTDNGLSRIYDKDMKVKTYHFGKTPGQNMYSPDATTLPDGRLIFGTQYGLTIITPQRHYKDKNTPAGNVHITDIRINGMTATGSHLIDRVPNYAGEITLPATDNSIDFSFSNFAYNDIESAFYQFYLEGADKQWRPMTTENHIEYTNLPPGKYVFHIKALANNKWSKEKTLTVTILQPWYNSWWAWIIYIALAAGAALYVYHNAKDKLRLHQQMMLEKQMTEFKLEFFTNITHEFRTPLAIIQGAVNKLDDKSAPSKATVQTVSRGTRRLLKLVNQLMEFRKVNTGNLRLQAEDDNLIAFVRDIYTDFWSLGKQKQLTMTFTPFDRTYSVAFDHRMVETMVYNLLSNAIKYTPECGSIEMTVKHGIGCIMIAVKDNGPGISPDKLPQLFKPFMHGFASQGGMGIGLYNAQQMAVLHKGTLTYRQAEAAGGALFTITLPDNNSAYSEGEMKKESAVIAQKDEQRPDMSEIIREMRPDPLNSLHVAIIEDDHDMMEQISNEVGVYFKTNCYLNGKSAIEGITANPPRLVICDVMLPDTTGYDIVRQLKENHNTASLPVIMLTALDDETHQLKAYKAGADDYMVKPCNFKLLTGRAMQLIKRQLEAEKKKNETPDATPANADSSQKAANENKSTNNTDEARLITSYTDKLFVEKLQIIIAQHLSDSEYNVEKLAGDLNMGRTKLFNKTKQLTGLSPNKLLHNERMRYAAELLAAGELTISEICYKVGMQDVSYFNKCFKTYYGVAPSKYNGPN